MGDGPALGEVVHRPLCGPGAWGDGHRAWRGDEWAWYKTGTSEGPPSVRAFLLSAAPPTSEIVVKRSVPPSSPAATKPALFDAATPSGGSGSAARVAAVYRVTQPPGKDARELWGAWIDPTTAKPIGTPKLLAKGDVGAPAALVDKDTMQVVFAERPKASDPYHLSWVTWGASPGSEPSARITIAITTKTALAPSIAKLGSAVALAWMNAKAAREQRDLYRGVRCDNRERGEGRGPAVCRGREERSRSGVGRR